MTDFLLVARDRGLYRAITDNGAGGLSSSIGEMARLSGGAELDLSKAPLKYPGLNPWEILLSEAQERMSLAVEPEKIDDFLELANKMEVEATVLGKFTDNGQVSRPLRGQNRCLPRYGISPRGRAPDEAHGEMAAAAQAGARSFPIRPTWAKPCNQDACRD